MGMWEVRVDLQTVTAAQPARPPHMNDSQRVKGVLMTFEGVGTATGAA